MKSEAVAVLVDWITRVVSAEGARWLREATLRVRSDERELEKAIALAPRRLGRADLNLVPEDMARSENLRPGFDPRGLSTDQAARIALLLSAPLDDDSFAKRIASCARTADLSESIALYRGLPLYPAPESLLAFAREGIRSGIAPVFEAVAHANPYPREHFDEAGWNQMVLKALFMERPLAPIQGLDERANPELALMLVDYAHERWSAGRPVSPELWRCVGRHCESRGLAALETAFLGKDELCALGAGLALGSSPNPGAAAILGLRPDRAEAAARISWAKLLQR